MCKKISVITHQEKIPHGKPKRATDDTEACECVCVRACARARV
jgi:hypothetical protein